MKTILLIRHAKSSWDKDTKTDKERPLNERGKRDAPLMARRLLKRNIIIDAFLSSPAIRAKSTAAFFAKEYGIDKNELIIVPELYMADSGAFMQTIRNAPPEAATIALFSHNDGITEFSNSISEARIDHMPTCAVFAVQSSIEDWHEFRNRDNLFYFFDYPKADRG